MRGPAWGTVTWELRCLSPGLGLPAPCGGSPLPPGATAETLAPRLLQQSQRFTGDAKANYKAGSAAQHPSAELGACARLGACWRGLPQRPSASFAPPVQCKSRLNKLNALVFHTPDPGLGQEEAPVQREGHDVAGDLAVVLF